MLISRSNDAQNRRCSMQVEQTYELSVGLRRVACSPQMAHRGMFCDLREGRLHGSRDNWVETGMSIHTIIRATSGRYNTCVYGFLAAVSTDMQCTSTETNLGGKTREVPGSPPQAAQDFSLIVLYTIAGERTIRSHDDFHTFGLRLRDPQPTLRSDRGRRAPDLWFVHPRPDASRGRRRSCATRRRHSERSGCSGTPSAVLP